jgi:hypothetical protein
LPTAIADTQQATAASSPNDEVVDEFLRVLLVSAPGGPGHARSRSPGCGAAEGRRGAVLLLDRGQVAEVEPLVRLARARRGTRDVVAVARAISTSSSSARSCSASSSRKPDDVLGGEAIIELGGSARLTSIIRSTP